MSVFLKSFLPVPRRHSNIAKVAPSARIFIQDVRNEGFGKTVLVLEVGRESVGSFENDFNIAKWDNVPKRPN